MTINKRYIIYELNRVMGSEKHLALEKISFNNMQYNSFDSEEEAVKALIDDMRTFEEYLIIPSVYIN